MVVISSTFWSALRGKLLSALIGNVLATLAFAAGATALGAAWTQFQERGEEGDAKTLKEEKVVETKRYDGGDDAKEKAEQGDRVAVDFSSVQVRTTTL